MEKDARSKLLAKVPTRKLVASIKKDLRRTIREAKAASKYSKR
jgi:hypothetical protein